MKHQYPEIKELTLDHLKGSLGFATVTGKLERVSGCLTIWVCNKCKSMKYSCSEGCNINLATLTFLIWIGKSAARMAIFYPKVVFWVSCSEAEWLFIMFVRGNFIVELWNRNGCWAHTDVWRRVCVWELLLIKWLYWICRHLSFFVTNKPCPQPASAFRAISLTKSLYSVPMCWLGLL